MHNTEKKKMLGAFMAGALTTAVVGGILLFGPGGRRRHRKMELWVLRAQTEILNKMEDISDITKEQYDRVVDRVTRRYALLRYVGQERARQVGEDFKRRFQEMKRRADKAREEAESEEVTLEEEDDGR